MSRHTLTRDQLNNIIYLVEDWAINDEHQPRIHATYSGRGMYGETCIGLTHDNPNLVTIFLYYVAEELGEDLLDLIADLGGAQQDNMGLSTITYWPHLTCPDANQDEEATV